MRKLSEIFRIAMQYHVDHSHAGDNYYMCFAVNNAYRNDNIAREEAHAATTFAQKLVEEVRTQGVIVLASALGTRFNLKNTRIAAAQVWQAVVDKLEEDGK